MMTDNKCVVCEEEAGTVRISHLVGYGDNVLVCSTCYSDCDPMGGDEE